MLTILYLYKYTVGMNTRQEQVEVTLQTASVLRGDLQGADVGLELFVAFESGEAYISAEQKSRIKAWHDGWLGAMGRVDVLLGGASHTGRVARLRRFHGLLTVLEQLGIASKHIFPEIEWAQPARMGALDDMPIDTIWLRLCRHSKHRVLL